MCVLIYPAMRVSKWGNSLAARLPSVVVNALDLKEGDAIEIEIAGEREFTIARDRNKERAIHSVRRLARPLPPISSSTVKKSISDKPFFDTNVLIYAFSVGDERSEIARALLARGATVGVQSLNEFVAVARRKLKMA